MSSDFTPDEFLQSLTKGETNAKEAKASQLGLAYSTWPKVLEQSGKLCL